MTDAKPTSSRKYLGPTLGVIVLIVAVLHFTERALGPAKVEPSDAIETQTTPEVERIDWERELDSAENLGDFAAKAGGAARTGDAQAQFAMHRLLETCARPRQDSVAKCATFPESVRAEYETAEVWLARAAQNGVARASHELAVRELVNLPRDHRARSTAERAENDMRIALARMRLVEALRSSDPYLTWRTADSLATIFGDSPETRQATWVWRLAACEQGLSCGYESPWVKAVCERVECRDFEDGATLLLRQAGGSEAAKHRARELGARLRAGDFDDRALEASVRTLQSTPARIMGSPRT
jgi:hypothetical protein